MQGAIDAHGAQSLLDHLRQHELPLVLACHEPDLGDALLEAASLIVVPSASLAASYARRHSQVAVLEPLLDEQLFLAGMPATPGAPPAIRRDPGEPVRLLLAADELEQEELELARAIVERLSAGERRYELDVVDSPDPEADYPDYVRVLRDAAEHAHAAISLLPRAGSGEAVRRYLQYAALGVPGVYAATDELMRMHESGGGIVCPGGLDQWSAAIERIATDAQLAARVREAAWHDLVSGRLARHGAQDLLRVIGRGLTASPSVAPAVHTSTVSSDAG
jgi:hypothetical protein